MKPSLPGIHFRALLGMMFLSLTGYASAQNLGLAHASGFGLLGPGIGSVLVGNSPDSDAVAPAQTDVEAITNPWGYHLDQAMGEMLFLANNLPVRPAFHPANREAAHVPSNGDTLALRSRAGVIDTFVLRVSENIPKANSSQDRLAALSASHLPFHFRNISPSLGSGETPAVAADPGLAKSNGKDPAPNLITGMVAVPETSVFIGLSGALVLLRKRR